MSHCAGQRRAATPARTYYFDDTNGSSGYRGTSEDAPYKTITTHNALTFKPGDRVLFKRGEDWADAVLTPPSSGRPGRPIVYGAYGSGDRPIIIGAAASYSVNMSNRSYISLTSINAQASAGSYTAIEMNPAHDITVSDCVASGSLYGAIYAAGAAASTYHIIIENCDASSSGNFGVTAQHSGAGGPNDVTVANCTCYGNGTDAAAHHGVYLKYTTNAVVRGCECYGNAAAGIKINSENDALSAAGGLVYDNYLHDNRYGIVIASENGTYYNNLIVNSTSGSLYGIGIYWINAPRSTGNTVVHNTIVNSQLAGLGFYQDSTHTGNVIKNNLVVQDNAVVGDKKCIWLPNNGTSIGSLNTWNNNQYFTDNIPDNHLVDASGDKTFLQWQALAGEASSANGDAVFITEYTDLHLQSSSGAIARGDPAVGVTQDKDGVVRGAAVDAGCYEYVA